MTIAVVIPTYNENANISLLVEKLLGLPYPLSVIIVDDNSPDGTGATADSLAKADSRVRVIHRKGKGGRGSACEAGFKLALEDPSIEYVVEMDADFSHSPNDLRSILDQRNPEKVIVGSRYIKGGKIVGWSLWRSVFSKLTNLFVRVLLGVPLHDYTNGFRCYPRNAIEGMDFSHFRGKGFIALSEVAWDLWSRGFTFLEVPITFVNRQRGQSNFSLGEVWEAARAVVLLKWRILREGRRHRRSLQHSPKQTDSVPGQLRSRSKGDR